MLLEQISIHAWLKTNQIKTEGGKPLDFHHHRYLYDIYCDNSKYLACLKAGQIGFFDPFMSGMQTKLRASFCI